MAKKVVTPMKLNRYGDVFCVIDYTDGKLSISGVVGPLANGDCKGGCGQIDVVELLDEEHTFYRGWNEKLVREFQDIWNKWHLNDMRAGCEHQRSGWDLEKTIQVVSITPSIKFYQENNRTKRGEITGDEYEAFVSIIKDVKNARGVLFVYDWVRKLIDEGWVSISKTSKERAIHTLFDCHPEGLLTKPCEVCGYKFGSRWLFEEVPDKVIEWLFALPKPSKVMPKAWR